MHICIIWYIINKTTIFAMCSLLCRSHKVLDVVNWSKQEISAAAVREKPMTLRLIDGLITENGEKERLMANFQLYVSSVTVAISHWVIIALSKKLISTFLYIEFLQKVTSRNFS